MGARFGWGERAIRSAFLSTSAPLVFFFLPFFLPFFFLFSFLFAYIPQCGCLLVGILGWLSGCECFFSLLLASYGLTFSDMRGLDGSMDRWMDRSDICAHFSYLSIYSMLILVSFGLVWFVLLGNSQLIQSDGRSDSLSLSRKLCTRTTLRMLVCSAHTGMLLGRPRTGFV